METVPNPTNPRITGLSGRPMRVSSLRPGDVIELRTTPYQNGVSFTFSHTVLINSVKLQRIVLRDRVSETPLNYSDLHRGYYFVRHQAKRRWLAFLPKWIAKKFSPYSL